MLKKKPATQHSTGKRQSEDKNYHLVQSYGLVKYLSIMSTCLLEYTIKKNRINDTLCLS